MTRPIVAMIAENDLTGEQRKIYSLIDPCANKDYASLRLAKTLGLEISNHQSTLFLAGRTDRGGLKSSITIRSLCGNFVTRIEECYIGDFPISSHERPPAKMDLSAYEYMDNIDFHDIDADIEMLLCVGHIDAWQGYDFVRGGHKEPIAVDTAFGWTIQGITGKGASNSASLNLFSTDNGDLKEMLEQSFCGDFIYAKQEGKGLSKESEFALEQMEKSFRWSEPDDSYVVGLPFKVDREKVIEKLSSVDSKGTAERRAWSLKRSMIKDPDKFEKGFKEVEKFLAEGKAKDVTEEDDRDQKENNLPLWYLPSHMVFQKNKWRFCHDGRSETDGICLNDLLVNDLNLMNPLIDTVNNLRSYLYAFSTDISAFFHNVLVDEKDRNCFRFYWYWDRAMTLLRMLIFLAFIFGSSCSPTVTCYTMRRHSERMMDKYSAIVCEIMRRFIYVDDLSGGANTKQDCKAVADELEQAMAEGGFTLSKWKFSHEDIDQARNSEETGKEQKVLGIAWDMQKDTLSVSIEEEKFRKPAETTRDLVRMQASLFDPLGMIAPNIMIGRSWTQKSMHGNWGWDKKLERSVRDGFNEWANNLTDLKKLHIPRAWDTEETVGGEEELHVFADAAKTGYGIVAYRRVIGKEGAIRVVFLMGKSHVTPKDASRTAHHNSIPRLELTAAVKATEALETIQRSLRKRIEKVTLWSDSECVITWINNRSKPTDIFVSNRISKIDRVSVPSNWKYVSSKRNPADYTSKGINASETRKWKEYHYGPKWLSLPEKDWPKMKMEEPEEAMINATRVSRDELALTSNEEKEAWWTEVAGRVSGWRRKVALIGAVKRCAELWKTKTLKRASRERSKQLEQIKQSKWQAFNENEKLLLKAVQVRAFTKERRDIKRQKINKPDDHKELRDKESKLHPHNPFLDEDGLLRVGSRIMMAPIAIDTRCPVLLPQTELNIQHMIRMIHFENKHAGAKFVLNELRQKVWILKGLTEVQKVVKSCIVCQTMLKPPCKQKMAQLPATRLETTAPFATTGIDCAGPFLVKLNGRADHKVYVLVMTCFQTRAVHLETMFKLDADSAINAIMRFKARRPALKAIYSDNASNFAKSDKWLRKEMEKLNKELPDHLNKKGIEWNFIPPYAPNHGGVWERVVGLMKKHLKTALIGDKLHYETFSTIVTEIEGVLNRRPLTAISSDSRDFDALTPNHIINPASTSFPAAAEIDAVISSDAETTRRSWKRALNRVNQFWEIFKKDYFPLLHGRSKWRNSVDNLKKDDFVILVDETLDRNLWKFGRVTKTLGTSNHIRRVEVKRPDGKIVIRDRQKIVKLELDY